MAAKVKIMTYQFDVIIEQDAEGYFVASVPALPGCHTQAKSLDVLMERIRAAIELWLEVESPPPAALNFIGIQVGLGRRFKLNPSSRRPE